MSEGNDQDRLQPHSPAQQQSGENFNGMGENGTNDLGDFGNVAGGDGAAMDVNADTAGSAAGAKTGGGMEQEAPGYGSTGQHGYGDESGAMGGSTGGQQSGEQFDTEEADDDVDGAVGSSAAAGPAI